jgi:hypothetical protein
MGRIPENAGSFEKRVWLAGSGASARIPSQRPQKRAFGPSATLPVPHPAGQRPLDET